MIDHLNIYWRKDNLNSKEVSHKKKERTRVEDDMLNQYNQLFWKYIKVN